MMEEYYDLRIEDGYWSSVYTKEHPMGIDYFIDNELVKTEYKDGTICHYNLGHITRVEYSKMRTIKKAQLEKFKVLNTWSNVHNFMDKHKEYLIL